MNLWTRIRDYFRPSGGLRNKPGGMAYIRGGATVPLASMLFDGSVVKTVSFSGGVWAIDPPLPYRDWFGGQHLLTACEDEFLVPIEEGGITDEEVRDLYQPAPVRTTEPA